VGVGKWLGYFDKFVIFPWVLRGKIAQLRRKSAGASPVVHICDHSNAFYQSVINAPTLVTCHDLLAVRGALGEDTDCAASRFGKILQRMILRGLGRADFVICDSAATRNDLLELTERSMAERSAVVLLAQNHAYTRLAQPEVEQRLSEIPGFNFEIPFLLSVGLNLRRKNRRGILRVFSQMHDRWPGQVVFAGEPLDSETFALAQTLGVEKRVVQIQKPSNAVLEALYNQAFALFYPSKCEGFGWPIIEAQACGCPVVCSDRTSVPEVAGKGGVVCGLEDEAAFAQALLSLQNEDLRRTLIANGYANLERFRVETMMDNYLKCYRHLAGHADLVPTAAHP
jgi:glycosyltransferase involved in cell wall biosynthesis